MRRYWKSHYLATLSRTVVICSNCGTESRVRASLATDRPSAPAATPVKTAEEVEPDR